MSEPVVTRFAPSPTGYLHIGGARTALFNWLYARARGGRFLLRIEDTDRARHNEAAVAAIIDGLSWLGLDWDGEPVSQYARRDRHAEVAHALLDKGAAYRCYMTPEETEAARERARAEQVRFESPWRDADPARAPADRPFAVRFKAPRAGETIVRDAVQGEVRFPNDALDDLILLRSDGAPTYNLAVVVDDHDMGVTHVVRGDDHLNNAARQQQIYEALGWRVPVFAHVPLIHGPDGKKLSKRHGALGVEAYRDDGFLPEGLANYLLRLGWSHGDDEIIPRERALEWFDIADINKAPARLDFEKLRHVNAHYVRTLTDDAFAEKAAPFIEAAGHALDEERRAMLVRAAPFLKERCATLKDVVEAGAFLFLARPLAVEGKAAKPLQKEGARALVKDVAALLTNEADWSDAAALDEALRNFAESRGLGFGQVGPALRAALTAGRPAPGLGETLYSLGRAESLARLADQAG
ncbi:glutamate--tRNA ligase [Amphiplicatus metriothermophilus]|uniref:Glutamate--tRNA ligase n=1 Tax=Amphiplicatus metriothermophilus TaxID=1519374 RepID=A0A239Q066_9PROT|nr:glutamate--tRNA ligase [Amphiplicatus metriothermophilus]MBB5520048.1 glutamyl-tRNA synthetase [Amphiplicatus metriothermophilus]SNT75820.1 glutamyl-tRNA synthetase [Amphiplicatus metriothermophilus]